MATYIPAYKGYVTDVPELWFKRNDGRIFHFDQLTAFNASPNVNFTEVNAGWSLYPVAYLPGQSTMEMQATSGQFNAEIFAMANGQNFTENGTYMIPFTEVVELKTGVTSYTIHTDAPIVNTEAYPVSVEGMTAAESATGIPAGSFYVAASTGADDTGYDTVITVGDFANADGVATMDVTYYLEKAVKQIQIDNKTTAVGELIAKWPVYSSGEEGNAGGVKGHLIMQVYKCRITQMPGFDTSYKSAATNSVTFSTVESRAHEHAYSIAYYELPQAA